MRPETIGGRGMLAAFLSVLVASSAWGQPVSDDLASRLGLADMPAYRAALSGKATADDARATDSPRAVSFRDLWDHASAWSGRRVVVRGRIARIFRQGAVGSFPPLVEAWLSTPAGDILCIVFPQEEADAENGTVEPGKLIAFTGTFLKTIRYPAGDQARLAPLIVGDRRPELAPAISEHDVDAARGAPLDGAGAETDRNAGRPGDSWSPLTWSLGLLLGLVAAGVLAWQHLRGPARARPSASVRQGPNSAPADPPLEFLDTESASGPAPSDT